MIELLKIIKGIYYVACVPHFEYTELTDNLIRTRGNKFKLVQHHCHYDLRKYNFTNRVIPIWNSLSNHVVSAKIVVVVVLLYGLVCTRLQHSKNIKSCIASR